MAPHQSWPQLPLEDGNRGRLVATTYECGRCCPPRCEEFTAADCGCYFLTRHPATGRANAAGARASSALLSTLFILRKAIRCQTIQPVRTLLTGRTAI